MFSEIRKKFVENLDPQNDINYKNILSAEKLSTSANNGKIHSRFYGTSDTLDMHMNDIHRKDIQYIKDHNNGEEIKIESSMNTLVNIKQPDEVIANDYQIIQHQDMEHQENDETIRFKLPTGKTLVIRSEGKEESNNEITDEENFELCPTKEKNAIKIEKYTQLTKGKKHGLSSKKISIDDEDGDNTNAFLNCEFCDRIYRGKYAEITLRKHISKVHGKEVSDINSKIESDENIAISQNETMPEDIDTSTQVIGMFIYTSIHALDVAHLQMTA